MKKQKKASSPKLLYFPGPNTCEVFHAELSEEEDLSDLFQDEKGGDMGMESVLGHDHIDFQSYEHMTHRERHYLFISIVYVFLLHPKWNEFNW